MKVKIRSQTVAKAIEIEFPSAPTTCSRKNLERLATLIQASSNLVHVLHHAVRLGLLEVQDDETRDFVLASRFHSKIFIRDPADQLIRALKGLEETEIKGKLFPGEQRLITVGDILANLKDSAQGLAVAVKGLESTKAGSIDKMDVCAGTMVPTVTPWQSYHRLLCRRPVVAETIEALGSNALLEVKDRAIFSDDLQFKVPTFAQYLISSSGYGNGVPTMVFFCLHPGQRSFIFGCSVAKWIPFLELQDAAREIRNYRLKELVPFSKNAYQTLQRIENRIRDDRPASPHLSNDDLKWQVQEQAVEKMHEHVNSLGGSSETGLAYQPWNWQPHQACYGCACTMRYQQPPDLEPWTEDEKKVYMQSFSIEQRLENVIACAESETRIQCMILHNAAGRPGNS